MTIDLSGFAPICGDGRRGHAEGCIGGGAIEKMVLEKIALLGIKLPEGTNPCAFLDSAFDRGEPWATKIYLLAANAMGLVLANIKTYDTGLRVIIWKGSFAVNALKRIGIDIRKAMKRHLIHPKWALPENLKFMLSPNPEFDALIGLADQVEKML